MHHYKAEFMLHSNKPLTEEQITGMLYLSLDKQDNNGNTTREVTDVESNENNEYDWDELLGYE
jgi:hypothetical protein